MEIVNEIKAKDDIEKPKFVHRTLAEVQRSKLEKLMKNPEKPVIIPESTKRDKEYNAPSFVRNVMGSSAGAGSGEFHVYRHLRRKEYARQKHLKMQSESERLNEEFQDRLEENQRKADEKTNKKRAKRLKQKLKAKAKGKKPKLDEHANGETESEGSDGSGNEDEDEDNSETKNIDSKNETPAAEEQEEASPATNNNEHQDEPARTEASE